MALKLEKAFKVPAQYWLDLQTQYELQMARAHINLDNVEVIENGLEFSIRKQYT